MPPAKPKKGRKKSRNPSVTQVAVVERMLTRSIRPSHSVDQQLESLNQVLANAARVFKIPDLVIHKGLLRFLGKRKNWRYIRRHQVFWQVMEQTPKRQRGALIVQMVHNMARQADTDGQTRLAMDAVIESVTDHFPKDAPHYFEQTASVFERKGTFSQRQRSEVDPLNISYARAVRFWDAARKPERSIPLLEKALSAIYNGQGNPLDARLLETDLAMRREELARKKKK